MIFVILKTAVRHIDIFMFSHGGGVVSSSLAAPTTYLSLVYLLEYWPASGKDGGQKTYADPVGAMLFRPPYP